MRISHYLNSVGGISFVDLTRDTTHSDVVIDPLGDSKRLACISISLSGARAESASDYLDTLNYR